MDLNELYKQLDQRPPGFTEFDKDTEGNPIVYPGERFCRVKVGEGLCPNTSVFICDKFTKACQRAYSFERE
ncbi:hypothetical protein BDR22DRAFT_199366 [Usnea florida]